MDFTMLFARVIGPLAPWLIAASSLGINVWQHNVNTDLRAENHTMDVRINGDPNNKDAPPGLVAQLETTSAERDRYRANAAQYETQNGALQALNATLESRNANLLGQLRNMRAQLSLDLSELSSVPTAHQCISSPPVRLALEQLRRLETPGEPERTPDNPHRTSDAPGLAIRLVGASEDAEPVV